MKEYDVIIVGSGPAGGECARQLAKRGCSVYLADRMRDFSVNSYSSAGAPEEILAQYQLPEKVISARWNRFNVHSSRQQLVFESEKFRGVVMDFTKLRSFLAEEAKNHGSTVELDTSYCGHKETSKGVSVTFKTRETERTVQAKILVDATGSDQRILEKPPSSEILKATGIEYLVDVPESAYEKWANALSFFMGHRWMPQGYSWIFPMEKGKLKVGVCRYFQNEQIVAHKNSFDYYLENMMRECLGTDQLPILDKHGKAVRYCRRHVKHFNGPIIGIGDAVSTINPLALEGIRHAMASAQIAAKHIVNKLDNPEQTFASYQSEIQKYYGYKWLISEKLASYIYRAREDDAIDEMLEAYKGFSFDEIFELGFHYDLRGALKFLARWGVVKASKLLGIRRRSGKVHQK